MYVISIVCVLIAAVTAGGADLESGAGYSVHGIKLRSRSDQQLISELQQSVDLDIWQYGLPEGQDTLVMLSPENRVEVLDELDAKGIEHYLHLADVKQALETHAEEVKQWKQQSRSGGAVPFNDYPRYAEVDAYMESIAAQYPNLVTIVNAGKSFEGRDIKYLKISTTNFADASKPIYFMDAMMHAREWVTTPPTLYSIHRLVENLRDQDKDLLEDVDWIILPIANPDGYEYTHINSSTRMWRKTRSVNPEISENCIGVDPNRNFDTHWNTTGVSPNPCAETFPGNEAFSEPETRIVRDILLEHLDRMQVYMNIHSHGNWVLYGFDNYTLPPNYIHLHLVGASMGSVMDTMKLPQADWYKVGNSAMVFYETSGSAQDYGQLVGVPLSYTLELPGYGYGFLVPPQFIDHINKETWEGIAVTARMARIYHQSGL
ncbi:hypothetical protein ABMA27_008243 [Loxostege sticticalis]|uniref:Peptidase M14 domain-containing protein n=1 Tax=Loxostege sticticalis TaxID=481309 RepID=A0ABR3HAK6_LOXSC